MALQRVILTTGGTGGHIFPALAVAEAIRNEWPAARVLFVGGETGPEARLCEQAGLEFLALPVRGIIGRGKRAVGAMAAMLRSVIQAMGEVKRFSPQVVAGFGGYASFPAMLAGCLQGIPTLLHEQNSVPGVSNRLLGRLAQRVLLSFPDVQQRFPAAKSTLVGNPVRQAIAALGASPRTISGENRLLVLGGSQGAIAVNDAIIGALPHFREAGVQIVHQAGAKDVDRTKAAYEAAGWDASCVHAFMDDMAAAYAWADMAVCRAGASTVFELAAAGLPAVFIPFPFATHDHQAVNARHMAEAGAAVTILQQDLASRDLSQEVLAILTNHERLTDMGQAARAWARPQAAAAIATAMAGVAGEAKTTTASTA